jgi:hypothetical protein
MPCAACVGISSVFLNMVVYGIAAALFFYQLAIMPTYSNLQWLVLTHQWIVIHIAIKNLRIQVLGFTKQ